jgi:Holliday junction resolvase RusA-like endonuclease
MKIIELENIKIVGINTRSRVMIRNGKPFYYTDKKYKEFKKCLTDACINTTIQPPYSVTMHVSCYHDIDAVTKVVLDALEEANVINNDRHIYELFQYKTPIKKSSKGSIEVWVTSLDKEEI